MAEPRGPKHEPVRTLSTFVNFVRPGGDGPEDIVTYGPDDTLPAWAYPVLDAHPSYYTIPEA